MATEESPPPQLHQQHFRVTAVTDGFHLSAELEDGNLVFGGYLADLFEALSQKANFTYELLTPSGFGSLCVPQLNSTQQHIYSELPHSEAYSEHYYSQFDCGTNDVNDAQETSVYSTDLYLGMYYVTPQRQKRNYFTMPFQPPHRVTPAMFGTARGIRDFHHLLQLQQSGQQPPICAFGSGAVFSMIQETYPDLLLQPFFGTIRDIHPAMLDGTCPIFVMPYFYAATFVHLMAQENHCYIHGKPIGIIGEPMESGLSHMAIGVGTHLDYSVVQTLSYWMNVMMVDGTLASLYQGGTGNECGYDLYSDQDLSLLSPGAIAGVTLGAVALVLLVCTIWHRYSLKQQEARYKKRFVQQIARNIQIGPRPGSIPPDKLSDEILHIGQGKGVINKADLARWMMDIKMDFLSEKDFDALWSAMDMDDSGEVDPVQFIVFLSACGPEFEMVYREQENMPKLERLKLAARRLSNIANLGEDGVRRLERELDRSSSSRGRRRMRRSGFKDDTMLQVESSSTTWADCCTERTFTMADTDASWVPSQELSSICFVEEENRERPTMWPPAMDDNSTTRSSSRSDDLVRAPSSPESSFSTILHGNGQEATSDFDADQHGECNQRGDDPAMDTPENDLEAPPQEEESCSATTDKPTSPTKDDNACTDSQRSEDPLQEDFP